MTPLIVVSLLIQFVQCVCDSRSEEVRYRSHYASKFCGLTFKPNLISDCSSTKAPILFNEVKLDQLDGHGKRNLVTAN